MDVFIWFLLPASIPRTAQRRGMTTGDFETELARGDKWKAVEVLLRGGDGATTSFQSNPHPPISHFGVAGSDLDHQVVEEHQVEAEEVERLTKIKNINYIINYIKNNY